MAREIWQKEKDNARRPVSRINALCGLFLTTTDNSYYQDIISLKPQIMRHLRFAAPALGRVIHKIRDMEFKKELADSVAHFMNSMKQNSKDDSPYGVPYKPRIWCAGWDIQRFGVAQYFIHKGWPEHGSTDLYLNALNFILGVHPG